MPDTLEVERVISDPGSLSCRRRPRGHPALCSYSGALAGMLMLVLLTACSGSSDSDSSSTSSGATSSSGGAGSSGGAAGSGASGSPGASGSSGASGSAGTPGSPGAPGSAGTGAWAAATTTASAGSASVSLVSCAGTSCSVTLAGDGSRATVFGTAIFFLGVQGGRASLRVGEEGVSCAPGQRVSSGPLDLECKAVGDDSVELTVSVR